MEIIEMPAGGPVLAKVSYDVYTPEFKRATVLEWAKSGMTQKGFAREKGIPDTTLSGWIKRWRAGGCEGAEAPEAGADACQARLVEVAPCPAGECSVSIGGAVVRFPASAIGAVVRELAAAAGR